MRGAGRSGIGWGCGNTSAISFNVGEGKGRGMKSARGCRRRTYTCNGLISARSFEAIEVMGSHEAAVSFGHPSRCL